MAGFLQANKLYRILIAYAHDGTEIYDVVDQELGGLEHCCAATKIKLALLQRYRDTIPVHFAVMTLVKNDELS
jgi:hypothetical protein